MFSGRYRTLAYLVLVVAVGALLFSWVGHDKPSAAIVSLQTVVSDINAGRVQRITVSEDTLKVDLIDGRQVVAYKEPDIGAIETLIRLGVDPTDLNQVKLRVTSPNAWQIWASLLSSVLPVLLIGGLLFFFFRQAQGVGNQSFAFGKSRARMFTGDKPTVTFDDVAGVEGA